ncbi:MAG: hypothetical protein GY809_17180 [Planctomycetes bacterium]|nr:hypothetical protein [Planctomycetota bacterium]
MIYAPTPVICMEFPTQTIQVKGVSRMRDITLLGSDVGINASIKDKALLIEPPMITPANNPCDYAWVFKVTGAL